MINLNENTLCVPGYNPEPILRWSVYFVTSEGTFDSVESASESCKKTGVPLIVPVPVAIGEKTYELVLNQGVILES